MPMLGLDLSDKNQLQERTELYEALRWLSPNIANMAFISDVMPKPIHRATILTDATSEMKPLIWKMICTNSGEIIIKLLIQEIHPHIDLKKCYKHFSTLLQWLMFTVKTPLRLKKKKKNGMVYCSLNIISQHLLSLSRCR